MPKLASDLFAQLVKHIFNCSFAASTFLDEWKVAKLCYIPKNNEKLFNDVNSRSMCLLNSLRKLREKTVSLQMNQFLSASNIMVVDQHAYGENHSTEILLLQLSDNCLKNMENELFTGVALPDFRAAFDLIDHNLLLWKLECCNFSTIVLLNG